MKTIVSKFTYAAKPKDLKIIQREVQKNADPKYKTTIEDAERILHLYTAVAYDEGYRRAMSDFKDSIKDYHYAQELIGRVKLKRRKKGFLHYTDLQDVSKLSPLIRKRMKSKTQRKNRLKYCEDVGIEFHEEDHVLSLCIHTGFEAGYIKGSSLEESAKMLCKDSERAEILMDLFLETQRNVRKD